MRLHVLELSQSFSCYPNTAQTIIDLSINKTLAYGVGWVSCIGIYRKELMDLTSSATE